MMNKNERLTLAISNGEVFTIFKLNLNQKTMFTVDAYDGAKIATAHSRDRYTIIN